MEQFDTHEPFTTVREALLFSAFSRLESDIPRDQKIQYVDEARTLSIQSAQGLFVWVWVLYSGQAEGVGNRVVKIMNGTRLCCVAPPLASACTWRTEMVCVHVLHLVEPWDLTI